MQKVHLGVQAALLSVSLLLLFPAAGTAQIARSNATESPYFVAVGPEARAYLGVGVRDVDSARAKTLNLKEEYGIEVIRVDENSPAEAAGIKAGDVVLEYNGQRVEGTEQFIRLVRETPSGRAVKLSVIRGGNPLTILATLGSRKTAFVGPSPEDFHFEAPDMNFVVVPDIPRAMMSWRNSVLGVDAEALGNTQLANYFGVKDGVLVRSVYKGTAAEKAGLRAGDVLLKVDADQVSAPRDVTNAMREARNAGKKSFPIVLMRERKEMTLTIAVEEPAQPAAPKLPTSPVSGQKL
jgi:serine protease Do